jgi:hypothetical protein
MTDMLDNPALSVEAAARHAGIATGTMRNRIAVGAGPKTFRIGRRVLVRLTDLEAWCTSAPSSVRRTPLKGQTAIVPRVGRVGPDGQ